MMGREIARMLADMPSTRIVYGVATALNTVQVSGADTAISLPALANVQSGDYCAILVAGADLLILGPVDATEWVDSGARPFIRADDGRSSPQAAIYRTESGTTDGSGDVSVTFPEPFTSGSNLSVVVTRAGSITSIQSLAVHTLTVSGFKCRLLNASGPVTSTSMTFHYVAMGQLT